MGDRNMAVALALGHGLASGELGLPSGLADVNTRARLVEEVDRPLLNDEHGIERFDVLGAQIRHMAACTEPLIPDVTDPLDRAAVALRLWAGCLMAAKTIAVETRSGPNTAAGRTELFAMIDQLAAADPVFCAGVEAAPSFKRLRNQTFSLDGVPADSAVRRFA
jgi:hypothetical protein